MQKMKLFLPPLLLGIYLLLFFGCTKSPFSEDKTGLGTRQIRGTVALADGASPGGVYVWLPGGEVGAYTEASGKFQLTLPSPSDQGTPGGLNGVFTVYFYLANYHLDSAKVFMRDGVFVYEKGDVNKNGELNATRRMQRLLQISTTVQRFTSPRTTADSTVVRVSMQADANSVTVIFPNACSDRECPDHRIGAVLLRNIASNEIFVVQMSPGANSRHVVTVGRSPVTRSMYFSLTRVFIPPAVYEVIPYLLIERAELPPGLLASLGPNVLALGPDYLKIPFRREGGRLEVAR
ncbi:MAG: hypothetical protein ACREOI_09135 [bacterium]